MQYNSTDTSTKTKKKQVFFKWNHNPNGRLQHNPQK